MPRKLLRSRLTPVVLIGVVVLVSVVIMAGSAGNARGLLGTAGTGVNSTIGSIRNTPSVESATVSGGLVGAPTTQVALAGASSAYSNESVTGTVHTDWMASLPGSLRLSDLSLPGTHDTGATKNGGDIGLAQSMTPEEQLKAGIRAWDIRLGEKELTPDGQLWVWHGAAYQGWSFEQDILGTATAFLKQHPGETIVMNIQNEKGIVDFETRVKGYLDKSTIRPYIYGYTSGNPTLDEMRGKIVRIDWSSLS